jgi:hypothetical protein
MILGMRMWMVDPRTMCRRHLMGEHLELHMLAGTVRKGISVRGYIDGGMMEPGSVVERHAALVVEMRERGYNHKSPLDALVWKVLPSLADMRVKIDRTWALAELYRRCPECRAKGRQMVDDLPPGMAEELDRLGLMPSTEP